MIIDQNNYLLTSSDAVRAVARLLFEQTPVQYFEYVRLYPDGSVIKLDTQKGVLEYILTNDLYLKPTDVPEFNRYMFMSLDMPAQKPNLVSKVLHHYKDFFNLGHFFFINEQKRDFTESFVFASHANNLKAVEYYVNHLSIFEKFCFYFRDKGINLITMAEEHKLILPEWQAYFANITLQQTKPVIDSSYLKPEILHLKGRESQQKLTTREFDCLGMYIRGASNKLISRKLGISIRTVETHIAHIKSKLHCNNRESLINLLESNGLLQFIF